MKAFLFLESLISLKKFGLPLILLNPLGANLAEKLLSMGSYLGECPVFDVGLNKFPVFAIPLEEIFEEVGFGFAPPSIALLFLDLS